MQTEPTVTDADVKGAERQLSELEPRRALARLETIEPVLAQHIWDGMERIWDKLRQCGLVPERGINGIDETVHPTILGLVVSSVEAARAGHRNAVLELVRRERHHVQPSPQCLISEALLEDVEARYWSLDSKRTMILLAELEPVLARFVARVTSSVLDSLDVTVDYQVSWHLQCLVINQIQAMGAVCVEALRRAPETRPNG